MLRRFLHLLALGAGIHVLARLVRSLVHAAGFRMEYDVTDTPGQVVLYTIGLCALLAFVALVWRISLAPAFGRYWTRRANVVAVFGVTAGVAFVTLLAEYGLLYALGMAGPRPLGWARMGWPWAGRLFLSLLIIVLLAATEELIFRGFVLNYLRGDGRAGAAAITASAFVFALAHHFPDPEAWLSPHQWPLFTGLFLLGVALALAYAVSGSLACSTGIHAALLAVEVLARHPRTRIVFVSQSAWWMGFDNDLRTALVVWAEFALLGLVVWWARGPLRAFAEVEPPP